eukprot:2482276-Amphidinium_carterae.1
MTPVAPTHPQAVGIWKSEGHSHRQGKRTLVIDLLMFSEEQRSKVYQARTGVILTKETIPWYSVVEDAIYIEIQHYNVCETVSWMLGGYDETFVLMDKERKPYEVCFGQSAKKYQLMDHIGLNQMPVAPSLTMAELDWQIIIQRLWPQELNFFHIDAPTRRRHCLAHYQAATLSEE